MIEALSLKALFQLRAKGLLTPTATLLYVYFSSCDPTDRHTYRSIAKETGISHRAIRYNLPLLELTGLMTISERLPTRNGGGFVARLRDPSNSEVKRATSARGGRKAILEYREWQYKERNKVYRREK